MTAHWGNLIMANYTVDPELLIPWLPKGVELDFYNGNTYVSLVGFLFKDSRIFGIPVLLFGTFEEVNLRFYVTRKLPREIRRGVVFIKEAVPNRIVAWLANTLYSEHYVAIPTRHDWNQKGKEKFIQYQWKLNKHWNTISVRTSLKGRQMQTGSIEEFIFEHYYGYTKVNSETTEEYNILHPRWLTYDVEDYMVDCDFSTNYGKAFHFLQHCQPSSIMLAEGSEISVKWKRNKITR